MEEETGGFTASTLVEGDCDSPTIELPVNPEYPLIPTEIPTFTQQLHDQPHSPSDAANTTLNPMAQLAFTPQQQEMMKQYAHAQQAAMYTAYMQAAESAAAASGNNNAFAMKGAGAAVMPVPHMASVAANTSTGFDFASGMVPPVGNTDASSFTPLHAPPLSLSQPTFVNAKQYSRILKRRETRHALELYFQRAKARQPGKFNKEASYQHESRHQHAKKRPRGKHGRFLTGQELEDYYRENPDKDPRNHQEGPGPETVAASMPADGKPASVNTTVSNENHHQLEAKVFRHLEVPLAANGVELLGTLPISPIVLAAPGGGLLESSTQPAPYRHHHRSRGDAGAVDPLLSEAAEAFTGVDDDEDSNSPPSKKHAIDYNFG